ncbi:hypothetical protein B6D60_00520 [candidate division KSB1 bacterium 4484_87]|nr:MAG: hypothetical protein B6D60_00520 [candidate division KSB1 bacterium 4484_87]
MRPKIFLYGIVLLILFLLIGIGCTDKYQPTPSQFASKESSCTYCHLNSSLLKEVATPLPPDEGDSGEG